MRGCPTGTRASRASTAFYFRYRERARRRHQAKMQLPREDSFSFTRGGSAKGTGTAHPKQPPSFKTPVGAHAFQQHEGHAGSTRRNQFSLKRTRGRSPPTTHPTETRDTPGRSAPLPGTPNPNPGLPSPAVPAPTRAPTRSPLRAGYRPYRAPALPPP